MIRVDKTVAKETTYVAVWIAILSLLMQAVFLFFRRWDYTILLGNLWGGALSVLNFFLMGLFVQKAVLETEEQARKTIKISYTLRTFLFIVLVVAGIAIPCFSTMPLIISLFFTRIAIFMKTFRLTKAKEGQQKNE